MPRFPKNNSPFKLLNRGILNIPSVFNKRKTTPKSINVKPKKFSGKLKGDKSYLTKLGEGIKRRFTHQFLQ